MSTVLCIDDNAESLNIRKFILGQKGYSVLTADNGADGLAALAENPVDVVVLDYRMPDMDELAVATAIRKRHGNILLLTGCLDEVPEELSHIVDASLTKGEHPEVLLRKLRRLTQREEASCA